MSQPYIVCATTHTDTHISDMVREACKATGTDGVKLPLLNVQTAVVGSTEGILLW